MENREKHENFVEVTVNTTAGSYPEEGAERVSAHQKVNVILKKAADHLKITDTSGWVATATVDGQSKTITVDSSYIDNGLTGMVDIDFGPAAGGGGTCMN